MKYHFGDMNKLLGRHEYRPNVKSANTKSTFLIKGAYTVSSEVAENQVLKK